MRVTFKCSCEHASCIFKTDADNLDWRRHKETKRMVKECTALGRHPKVEVLSLADEKTGQLRLESFL